MFFSNLFLKISSQSIILPFVIHYYPCFFAIMLDVTFIGLFRNLVKEYTTRKMCIQRGKWLSWWTKFFPTRNEMLHCIANDFRRFFVNKHFYTVKWNDRWRSSSKKWKRLRNQIRMTHALDRRNEWKLIKQNENLSHKN